MKLTEVVAPLDIAYNSVVTDSWLHWGLSCLVTRLYVRIEIGIVDFQTEILNSWIEMNAGIFLV